MTIQSVDWCSNYWTKSARARTWTFNLARPGLGLHCPLDIFHMSLGKPTCHLWAWSSLICKIRPLWDLSSTLISEESLNGSYNYPLSYLLIIISLSFLCFDLFEWNWRKGSSKSDICLYTEWEVLLVVHLMVTVETFFSLLIDGGWLIIYYLPQIQRERSRKSQQWDRPNYQKTSLFCFVSNTTFY